MSDTMTDKTLTQYLLVKYIGLPVDECGLITEVFVEKTSVELGANVNYVLNHIDAKYYMKDDKEVYAATVRSIDWETLKVVGISEKWVEKVSRITEGSTSAITRLFFVCNGDMYWMASNCSTDDDWWCGPDVELTRDLLKSTLETLMLRGYCVRDMSYDVLY